MVNVYSFFCPTVIMKDRAPFRITMQVPLSMSNFLSILLWKGGCLQFPLRTKFQYDNSDWVRINDLYLLYFRGDSSQYITFPDHKLLEHIYMVGINPTVHGTAAYWFCIPVCLYLLVFQWHFFQYPSCYISLCPISISEVENFGDVAAPVNVTFVIPVELDSGYLWNVSLPQTVSAAWVLFIRVHLFDIVSENGFLLLGKFR